MGYTSTSRANREHDGSGGQETQYKYELKDRNDRIRNDYAGGTGVAVLSRKYHLSEKSIRRILQKR